MSERLSNRRFFALWVVLAPFLLANGCTNAATKTVGGTSAASPASSASAAGEAAEATDSCVVADGITSYCGFTNPEDLVAAPGGQELFVSEMGNFLKGTPGSLAIFEIEGASRRELPIDWNGNGENWADRKCPAPDPGLFSPHGIDLRSREDGRRGFYVVNHGGRESVEFFELLGKPGEWSISWRGCVAPAGDPLLNDVAALPDGKIAVTHMWDKDTWTIVTAGKLLLGVHTGWVWIWSPATGFSRLPESEAVMPNGIASSRDGKTLYINNYMENRSVRRDATTGAYLGEVAVEQPDNVTVDDAGRIWIVGHHHFIANTSCLDAEGPCPLAYSVVRADAETMEGGVVFAHEGPPMGFATVALPVGEKLYLGTAKGDRMVSIPLASVTGPIPAAASSSATSSASREAAD